MYFLSHINKVKIAKVKKLAVFYSELINRVLFHIIIDFNAQTNFFHNLGYVYSKIVCTIVFTYYSVISWSV